MNPTFQPDDPIKQMLKEGKRLEDIKTYLRDQGVKKEIIDDIIASYNIEYKSSSSNNSVSLIGILLRVLILLLFSAIIGGIFGRYSFASSGYMSGLANAIMAPIVVGLMYLLFLTVRNFFRLWYLYPIVSFILGSDYERLIYWLNSQGLDDHLTAPILMWFILLILLSVESIVGLIKNLQSYSRGAKVFIALILASSFVFIPSTYAFMESRKQEYKNPLKLELQDVKFSQSGIIYEKYFEDSEEYLVDKSVNPTGVMRDRMYVSDGVNIQPLTLMGAYSNPCQNASNPNEAINDDSNTVLKTSNGHEYYKMVVKKYMTNPPDEASLFDIHYYCFATSNHKYEITRRIPPDKTMFRRISRKTVESAYSEYPIEFIIDSILGNTKR